MKDNLLLKVSNLDAGYGVIQVLWDVNLEVKQKEVVCVIGANGAGFGSTANATAIPTMPNGRCFWTLSGRISRTTRPGGPARRT